jgi:hypothetical protein
MLQSIGIWVASFLTLCIFSFLYKDNPFYRFAEHLFIGVSAGYWAMYEWYNILIPNLGRPLFIEHRLILFIPLVLGILMLLRLFPKIGWLSRWPLAFIVGLTSGYYLVTFLQTNALEQARATIVPLNSINNIILVIGVITGLLYFFFSTEHKGAIGISARIGRMFLMVAFGASFGYTVMARISLLIGRLYFLLGDWLHLV